MRVYLPIVYISLVIAVGAIAFCHGMLTWTSADQVRYLSFTIVALLASSTKVNLPSVTGTISMNFVFMLIGITDFSLGEALLTGCLGALVQSVLHAKARPKPIQVAFNFAGTACSIWIAYAVHHAPRARGVLLLAPIILFVTNTALVAVVIALTEHKKVWRVWRDSYFWSFPNYLVGASAAWVVSATSHVIGWQPSLLLLPILYVVHRSHGMHISRLEEARTRAEQQRAHAEEVAALHRRTIETLALAIEAKDQTTHDHLERVETYSVEVGRELGLADSELEALRAAALLHDIGKIAVPEYIISKPGKLTPEEFEKMKTHTIVGAEIVERIGFPFAVAPMVRGHHEKWNGTGYPDGLAGEQIPIGARILAAVDCLDALSSDRQYRRAMPLEEALSVIRGESGASFDERVVEVLVRRAGDMSKIAKSRERVGPLPSDVRVARGDAPAAGFQKAASSDTTSYDLASLHNSLTGNQKQTQSMASVLTAIRQCPDRNAVFAALGSSLREVVPYDVMVVYMRDAEHLAPEYLEGEDYRLFASLDIPIGAGLSGWVAENRKPIVNGNPSVEPGYLNDPTRFSILRSALAVPLISADGLTGVLSLYLTDADAFSTEHLAALMSLSPILAQALELTAAGSFFVREKP
jgi:putative nucleotidyltransferase with HDIG domain